MGFEGKQLHFGIGLFMRSVACVQTPPTLSKKNRFLLREGGGLYTG